MTMRTFALFSLIIGLLAAPLQVTAQHTKVPRIGYLSYYPDERQKLLAAFKQGLKELGYVDGENIIIEKREAQGKRKRVPNL